MKKLLVLIMLPALIIAGCQEPAGKTPAVAKRDTTVTPANSYSELFFDSTVLEKFITREWLNDSLANRMRSFYNSRNFQFAWFFGDGLANYANTFLKLQDDYINYSGDSLLYNPQLRILLDTVTHLSRIKQSDSLVQKTELLLTHQFFRYANRAYQGRNQLDVKELNWFIPRKKINPTELLDSLIRYKGQELSRYEPVNRQYQLLRDQLLRYYELKKKGGWPVIPVPEKSLRKGDSAAAVVLLKQRLAITGDLEEDDSTGLFTLALETAVKRAQHRFGLEEDGIAGKGLLGELNVPIDDRIRTMLINMERLRWVPQEPSGTYLLVNIPEFRLHVYDDGQLVKSMKVVAGSAAHNTVVFTGTLKYVVLSPYWYVPPGILKNEVLPGIKKDPNYLARHNMEKYGNTVRQRPGRGNPLGLVKFLFPNEYNIYLHDTPSKDLFEREKRAFSHGCIRLAEPDWLAHFLLKDNPVWDSTKIEAGLHGGVEKYISIKDTIPVFIGYFTAFVDRDGLLNFRDDLYGNDHTMAGHLFDEQAGSKQ